MRSPSQMNIIQIDITNACTHTCSNCTRFCGHHPKPFMMDMNTFKQAVDSLAEYHKIVGVMGGEPTLHPEFSKMVEYLRENRPENRPIIGLRQPVKNFGIYRNRHLGEQAFHRRGLWSSLGAKYYKNFELINDTFAYQLINDHTNQGLHQALLITRKELGIPDKAWVKLRDRCWIQNMWSASITPKGAFFCEVAAALDMLFDGSGGWPIEPGWWKRKPKDFGDQLQWCELCSGALSVPAMPGRNEQDIISPELLKQLKKIGSPKLKSGRYITFKNESYDEKEYLNRLGLGWKYIENEDERVTDTNKSLCPQNLVVVKQTPCAESSSDDLMADIIEEKQALRLEFSDWCLIVNNATLLTDKLISAIKTTIFNPGCCYYYGQNHLLLFNRHAMALQGHDELHGVDELIACYPSDKVVALKNYPEFVPKDTETPLSLKEKFMMFLRFAHYNGYINTFRAKITSPVKQSILRKLRYLEH